MVAVFKLFILSSIIFYLSLFFGSMGKFFIDADVEQNILTCLFVIFLAIQFSLIAKILFQKRRHKILYALFVLLFTYAGVFADLFLLKKSGDWRDNKDIFWDVLSYYILAFFVNFVVFFAFSDLKMIPWIFFIVAGIFILLGQVYFIATMCTSLKLTCKTVLFISAVCILPYLFVPLFYILNVFGVKTRNKKPLCH